MRGSGGEYGRTFRLDWTDGISQPVGFLDRGEVLALTARNMTQLSGEGVLLDSALISRYDLEGALVDSLLRLPHNQRFVQRSGNRRTTVGAPFSSFGSLAPADRGFCYAFGSVAEFRCYDLQGSLRRIVRVSAEPRPVTEEEIAGFWEEEIASAPEAYRRVLDRLRDVLPFPDVFPAFSRLLADDGGRIWALRFGVPSENDSEWWIFEGGRWIGSLLHAESLRIFDVSDQRVAGVWSSDLGVEYVRIYELAE